MVRPPRVARALVAACASPADRRYLLEDVDAEFARRVEADGPPAARRWYWWQALRGGGALARSVPAAVRASAHDAARGDLRIALRALRRRPSYAAGAVVTLALGLASVAAVGIVSWRVWLEPLPYPEPDGVVRVFELDRLRDGQDLRAARARLWISPPLLEDLRRHDWRTLEAVAGVSSDQTEWSHDDRAERLSVLTASAELFFILEMRPIVGRTLADGPDAEVVLSEAFWVRAFGADPGVIGRSLDLDGEAHRVVGVVALPPVYPTPADVVTVLRFPEESLTEGWRGARYLDAVARVRSGQTTGDAAAELDAFLRDLGATYPLHADGGAGAVVLGDDIVEPYRGILGLLMGAGAIFLVLAVANVAGLVATRRAQDAHQRAVRTALGAGRRRLLGSEVLETGALGLGAGALGSLLTAAVLGPIVALAPTGAPRIDEIGVDPWLVLALLTGGALVGTIVGVIAHVLSQDVSLLDRATRTTTGVGGRRGLVVGQMALTTLLATAGVVVLRHVQELRAVDLGFSPVGVVARPVGLSETRFPSGDALRNAWGSMLDDLEAQGVRAAYVGNPPVTSSSMRYGYRIPEAPDEEHYAQHHVVTLGYFDLMGIALREGRDLADTDLGGTEPVVVINEVVAARHYPDGDAVGRSLRLVGTPRRIVGVVAATRHFGPDVDAPEELYIPLTQDSEPSFGYLVARSERSDAAAVIDAAVAAVDPSGSVQPVQPFTSYVSAWYAPLHLQLAVVLSLGVVGLALAALGLFALVAYTVSMRTRELGIRKALGAPVGSLVRDVIAQGAVLAALGIGAGLAAWYSLVPAFAGTMADADRADPTVPVLVAVLVGGAALLASLGPALRSTRVDPAIALQAE